MPEAAQLRTGDFPLVVLRTGFIGLDRREMDRYFHSGNRVLLHAHDRELEAVNDVFGAYMNDHGPIHFEVQVIESDDVVLRIRVLQIEPERIRRADELDIAPAENTVRSGILNVP